MFIFKYWQLWHQKEIENAKNCGFFSTVIDALFASSLETSIGPEGLNDSSMRISVKKLSAILKKQLRSTNSKTKIPFRWLLLN
jgi:hypothetical protein